MARTIAQIQAAIKAGIAGNGVLAGVNSPSLAAHWQNWTFVIAAAQAVEEQLLDAYITQNEMIAAAAPAASAPWLQAQVFNFQYDATIPQIIQLNTDTMAYEYPTVNATKRIVTRCSVTPGIFNAVNIKVAKGAVPTRLDPVLELPALQSYISTIGAAGINYQVSSGYADKLYIGANISYTGLYAGVISDYLSRGITSFLAGIPFNGKVYLSDLEVAIKGITGVVDVAFTNVGARADGVTFSPGFYNLVQNSLVLNAAAPWWQTAAGYIIPETTTGYTLTNSLNLIAV